jgi:hypothetical protein
MQTPPLGIVAGQAITFKLNIKYKIKNSFYFSIGPPWPVITNLHPNLFCGLFSFQKKLYKFLNQE